MRFVVEVRIEDGDHPLQLPVTVGVIERGADLRPATGFGLFLQETKGGKSVLASRPLMNRQWPGRATNSRHYDGISAASLATSGTTLARL